MNTPTLEEQLINEIQNFLLPGVVFTPSDEIATQNGTYVVDATLKFNNSTVVIERGDKEDKKQLATEILDLWKDAFLIHQGGVDKVYQFAKREIEGFLPRYYPFAG